MPLPSNAERRAKRQERLAFIRAWAKSPRKVGAVVPSSRFLAHAMAAQIDPHAPGWVIELGPGTGAITRGLLRAGVKPERLMLVERDRRLIAMLQKEFPEVKVVRGDAGLLRELLEEHHVHKVNAIVSCLPLLSLPNELVENVIGQVFDLLPTGGPMVQFTYGPASPVAGRLCKQHGITGKVARRVLLNVPPATVWRYEKAA